jgi:LPS sulfotransferase NodH
MSMPRGQADDRKAYDLTDAEHDYPARGGPPDQTVLICTHPRSGSTLLGEALYFAGGLGCPIEYFHRGFRPGLADRWRTIDLPGHIRAVHRLRTDPGGVLSVKLFWPDIEEMVAELDPVRFGDLQNSAPADVPPDTYREIARLLEPIFPSARYVHLERRDRVRQAVSGVAAMQTRLWRVIPEMHAAKPAGVVEYDFERIGNFIAYSDYCHAHWRNFFTAIGNMPLTLTYEELVNDYGGTVRAMLDVLGSTAQVPPVRMHRQSDAVNETIVLRYLRDHRDSMADRG